MLHITHTTPGRLLSHLGRLVRDGEALLDRQANLGVRDPALWEVRVWHCLDQIAAPATFQSALESNTAEVGTPDLLDFDRPALSAAALDQLLRRRIRRRLLTLASVIEKVEALCEVRDQGA